MRLCCFNQEGIPRNWFLRPLILDKGFLISFNSNKTIFTNAAQRGARHLLRSMAIDFAFQRRMTSALNCNLGYALQALDFIFKVLLAKQNLIKIGPMAVCHTQFSYKRLHRLTRN